MLHVQNATQMISFKGMMNNIDTAATQHDMFHQYVSSTKTCGWELLEQLGLRLCQQWSVAATKKLTHLETTG
jgi:hypothetical protein